MKSSSSTLVAAVDSIRDIFQHGTSLPPNLQMYGFRWEPAHGGCPVTWITRQPAQPMPFSDLPRPDLSLTLLVGPKGGADLVVIRATADEKVAAAMKEREACAVECDRSAIPTAEACAAAIATVGCRRSRDGYYHTGPENPVARSTHQ